MEDKSRAYEIREAIRTSLISGRYPVGDRLPSERDLVAEFHASRDTVRRAIQDLEVRGYVERKGTLGTIVLDWRKATPRAPIALRNALEEIAYADSRAPQRSSEELIGRFHLTQAVDPGGTVLHADTPSLRPARDWEINALQVAVQTLVMRTFRIIGTADGIPYQTIESYYPAGEFIDLFRGGVTDESLQHWISEHYEPRAKRISEAVSWQRSYEGGRAAFNLTRHNDAVCVIYRRVHDADDRLLEVDRIIIPADLCRLRYEYATGQPDRSDAQQT